VPVFRLLVTLLLLLKGQRLLESLSLAGLIAISAATVQAAPVTFNTALPVAKDVFVNRELLVLMRSGGDASGLNRDRDVNVLVSVLGYGVNEKLALFGTLPYINKELALTMNGIPVARSNDGFGDLTLFGRYTLFQQNAPGWTFRVAGFAGTKMPTSTDDKNDNLGRLPTPLQLSTGAWDGFGGVVATWQTLDFELDGQISYRNNGEANGFEAGDEWRLDGSLQYRLWPGSLVGPDIPGFLYGVLEANLVYKDRNVLNGQDVAGSGGTTLFLSPGLQYVTKRWIVEGVVQFPISQNLHGMALENDYVVRTGFRWNF